MARKTIVTGLGVFIFLYLLQSIACADAILSWGACTGEVTGYRVYYGTTSGSYASNREVGNVTQYALSNLSLTEGSTYYFVVRAYNAAGEGPNSNEVIYTVADSTAPLPPGGVSCQAGTATLQWSANTESDLREYRVYYGTSSGQYQPYIPAGKATSYTVANLQSGTKYYFAVTAVDTAGNESIYSTEVTSTITSTADATEPVVAITRPTSSDVYTATSQTVNLSGTASDNVGVTAVYWKNSLGGYGKATGTSSWSISNAPLLAGDNVFTIAAKDAAGNYGRKILTVSYGKSVVADTTSPSLAIVAPTSSGAYTTTTNSVSISGTASDNIGVTQVTWRDNRNGSGTASGTTAWAISNLSLTEGDTVITITATDAAGNASAKTITMTYVIPDVSAPVVSIGAPSSSGQYQTANATVNLSGTASDNKAVTQVKWTNDRGGSDTASGTNTWSVSGVALAEGTNKITVTALDAAGNQGQSVLTVTYTPPDTIDPVLAILSPTDTGTYQTQQATLAISGSASDNVGVTQVRWSTTSGGSGTATGTQSWSATGIGLLEGSNTVSVTALDAAGNSAMRNLVVTYTKPDTTVPGVTIATPSGNPYVTTAATVNLSGTASDNVGVVTVWWSNSRGGSGSITGTSNWGVSNITLYDGDNLITVFAKDKAGNIGKATKTVTYKIPDTTPPVIRHELPTTGSYYTTRSATVAISGTASDNVGVVKVTWVNSKGGSGTASGTTSWSIAKINLVKGWNNITITATDAAGNSVEDLISVVKW
ncbi:MAG: Ig-like domain-containing protein [Thermodesulfobacteriota bacterium]